MRPQHSFLTLLFAGIAMACGDGGGPISPPGSSFMTVTVSPSGSGVAGVTNFVFTASGVNNIIRYTWDFGDGTTSSGTAATAAHVYSRAGVFVPQVEAEGSGGLITTATLLPITVRAVSASSMTLVPSVTHASEVTTRPVVLARSR